MKGLLDEAPLKVVSLIIAITLFVIVRSDKDASTAAYVKVVYTLPADRVLTSEAVGEVRIGVRGPWTRLSHFDERGVPPITVDCQNRGDGPVRFDENMVKLPVGLRVVSFTPPEVTLAFEPRETRDVPVEPILDGQPADGFRVVGSQVTPTRVRVEGARSSLTSLARVSTRPLEVKGARAKVEGRVALEPPPRHTRYVDGDSVTVKADIQPAMVEKTFEAVAVKVLGLTRLEGAVEPAAVKLILRGPSDLLGRLGLDQLAVTVDAQLIDARPPARYLRTVIVSGLPAGVAAEVQPDSVMMVTKRKRD
jgi:YbbR domain-containing protein